jgi:hypothetical protein
MDTMFLSPTLYKESSRFNWCAISIAIATTSGSYVSGSYDELCGCLIHEQ